MLAHSKELATSPAQEAPAPVTALAAPVPFAPMPLPLDVARERAPIPSPPPQEPLSNLRRMADDATTIRRARSVRNPPHTRARDLNAKDKRKHRSGFESSQAAPLHAPSGRSFMAKRFKQVGATDLGSDYPPAVHEALKAKFGSPTTTGPGPLPVKQRIEARSSRYVSTFRTLVKDEHLKRLKTTEESAVGRMRQIERSRRVLTPEQLAEHRAELTRHRTFLAAVDELSPVTAANYAKVVAASAGIPLSDFNGHGFDITHLIGHGQAGARADVHLNNLVVARDHSNSAMMGADSAMSGRTKHYIATNAQVYPGTRLAYLIRMRFFRESSPGNMRLIYKKRLSGMRNRWETKDQHVASKNRAKAIIDAPDPTHSEDMVDSDTDVESESESDD